MSGQHTPGRLVAELDTYPVMVLSESETWPLVDELGNEEGRAGVFVANTGDSKANARRLVACWNFCLDMQTETLESMTSTAYQMLMEKAAEKQELLDALKLAHGALHQAAADLNDWGCYAPAHFQAKHRLTDDVQAYVNAAETVRAAIAKVERKA